MPRSIDKIKQCYLFVNKFCIQSEIFQLPNFLLQFSGYIEDDFRPETLQPYAYLSTLGNVREGDLFGGVKHEYATHPRALGCSA